MAPDAERLHVAQAAFPAPFDDRADVIRVPEAVPGLDFHGLPEFSVDPGLPEAGQHLAQEPQALLQILAAQAALGAAALVPLPDLAPKIGRIALQAPLLDAGVAAESPPPPGNFQTAVTAETAALRPAGERGRIDPSGVGAAAMRAHATSFGRPPSRGTVFRERDYFFGGSHLQEHSTSLPARSTSTFTARP
jgi:hypothetical protein